MKLPSEIVGKNKIRDFAICRDYIDGLTPQQIILKNARTMKLGLRRCQRIISNNCVFIEKHIGWDKTKRIHILQAVAKKEIQKGGWLKQNRDIVDVVAEIREEMEGHKPKEFKHKIEGNITLEVIEVEDRISRLKGISCSVQN